MPRSTKETSTRKARTVASGAPVQPRRAAVSRREVCDTVAMSGDAARMELPKIPGTLQGKRTVVLLMQTRSSAATGVHGSEALGCILDKEVVGKGQSNGLEWYSGGGGIEQETRSVSGYPVKSDSRIDIPCYSYAFRVGMGGC